MKEWGLGQGAGLIADGRGLETRGGAYGKEAWLRDKGRGLGGRGGA